MSTDAPVLPLTRSSVLQAHEAIKPHIHLTPLLTNSTLSALASAPQPPADLPAAATPHRPLVRLFFKAENLQRAGAFKSRGANHALSRLSAAERSRGVITHSSGNHAQALALAARDRGIGATIVMPSISTPTKIAATQGYGARVVFSGSTAPEREAVVAAEMEKGGQVLVPPYDCVDVMLGQGTMALEIEAQYHDLVSATPRLSVHEAEIRADAGTSRRRLDAVITPCGGGGMLSGVATALAGTGTLVFGAEPEFEGANDAQRGLAADPPERIPQVSTLTVADGLRTPVGIKPWGVISDPTKVRGVFSVTEAQILRAWRLVLERMKMVVEPSAVVGLAVVLFNEGFRALVERESGGKGWDIGVVFSGGNTSVEAIGRLLGGGGEQKKGEGNGEDKAEREAGLVGRDGQRVAENVAG